MSEFILKKREIFAVGEHNGDVYTHKDLRDMVTAFNELDFKPAIKIGHFQEDNQSHGYVENVSKVGGKIVADLALIAKETYEAVVDKKYNRVSAEVYFNFNRNGKKYNKVIGALALLGHEIAGVAGLAPLYQIKETEFERKSNYDFDIIENMSHINNDGNENAGSGNNDGVNNMSDTEMKAYKDQVGVLTAQVDTLVANAASNESVASNNEKRYNDSQVELKLLKGKILSNEAKDKSKKCNIPALQGMLTALYQHALSSDEVTLKVYSANDGKNVDKSLVETLDGIVDYINDKTKVLFSEHAEANADRSEGYDDPSSELDTRVRKHMSDNKSEDYSAAMVAVFEADPELKTAYTSL